MSHVISAQIKIDTNHLPLFAETAIVVGATVTIHTTTGHETFQTHQHDPAQVGERIGQLVDDTQLSPHPIHLGFGNKVQAYASVQLEGWVRPIAVTADGRLVRDDLSRGRTQEQTNLYPQLVQRYVAGMVQVVAGQLGASQATETTDEKGNLILRLQGVAS